MSIHRVTNLFVGNGSALPANNAAPAPANINRLAIVGSDMKALNPAGGDTISTAGGDAITFFQELANGELKKSMPVKGGAVTSAKAYHYKPARRQVNYIGYQRGSVVDGTTTAAAGSIEVNASTDYNFVIRFKWDKTFFSERPEVLNATFTSSATATQLSIAVQTANAINNSAFGNQPSGIKCVKAIVVSDGPYVAASGSTPAIYGDGTALAATKYGVEIWGLDVNQFSTSTYKPTYVKFSVHVNDASGFGTTTTAGEMQSQDDGIGTYAQVSNMENYLAQYEGISNRRMWPQQTVTLTSSATPNTSSNVSGTTGNVTVVINEDVATVATATTILNPGELIDIDGVAYEIKYIRNATTFVVTEPFSASYGAGANLKVKYLYNMISIEFADKSFTTGPDVTSEARKSIIIATPAIDAGGAYNSIGTEATDLLDILTGANGWLTSTPLAPPTLTYA